MDELREKIMDGLREYFDERSPRWFEAKGYAMMIADRFMSMNCLNTSFREVYKIASEAAEIFVCEEGK